MYLADSSIHEKVEWVQDGFAHKFIMGTKNASIADTNGEDDAQERAVLSAIVNVTRENFYMVSDCGYHGLS